MAAVTEASRIEGIVFGNKRIIIAELTSVDNTDTWATGLSEIHYCSGTAQTNAAVGMTKSAGTITFANTGSLAVNMIVIGN